MQKKSPSRSPSKPHLAAEASAPSSKGLHPRNRHAGRYDFPALISESPELARFVSPNAYGDLSIDFADPAAVRALNGALLALFYGIANWQLPEQYLCPPIPGRADYLHYLADLLARSNAGNIPAGPAIRALDIGVGANGIYPLLGHHEYGWQFVGADIDRQALACLQQTIDANPGLSDAIELRLQPAKTAIFRNILKTDELFDLTLCNPPFHASIEDAQAGTKRKWKNLGKSSIATGAPHLNFSGRNNELCCPGGEIGFITRMIGESVEFRGHCLWFTTLVSKATSLPAIFRALKETQVQNSLTVEMAQGQKKSRFVAWTFFSERQQQAWRNRNRGEALPPRPAGLE